MKNKAIFLIMVLSCASAFCFRKGPNKRGLLPDHTEQQQVMRDEIKQQELTALEYIHAVIEELETVAVQIDDPQAAAEFESLADGLRSMLEDDVEPELIALLLEQIVMEAELAEVN